MISHGEGSWSGPTICLAMRSRRHLEHECSGFLAYVLDTQVEQNKSIVDLTILLEFPDVFPEDFLGVPRET